MLTNEPLYEGEPILAIAATTEVAGRRRHRAGADRSSSRCRLRVDPLDSLRPGGPNARLEGNSMSGR